MAAVAERLCPSKPPRSAPRFQLLPQFGMMVPDWVCWRRGFRGEITKDIQSVTAFRNHSAEFLQHLKVTGRPMALTVKGKAAAVVQDAQASRRLLDLAAEASPEEGIRQGLEDLADGRTRPASEAFDEIRAA